MRKLVYWAAVNMHDYPCYNLRARTKKELRELMRGEEYRYGDPKKITIEYEDAFDLFCSVAGEGGYPMHEGYE